MISIIQCQHVVKYYLMEMMYKKPIQVQSHISRDCIYMNKMRGEICANIYNHKKFHSIIELIHQSNYIEQLNSIPENNVCYIDNVSIPKHNSGVQIIIHLNNNIKHICIQKKYQKICYSYFKLRYFPEFIKQHVLKWLEQQPWYLPNANKVQYILEKVSKSEVHNQIHVQLSEIIHHLSNLDSA